MFAKLKKKIENEGGAVPSTDSSGRSSSHRDSVSSLSQADSIQHLGPSPPGSFTSESASLQDVSSPRDELVILLQRKSEQCKKLEGNITDLAALIKEKSKTIERLEATLTQQEEITNNKLKEQKEEFEKYRDKLIEGYQTDKLQLDKLLNTEEALATCRSDLETKTRQCHAAEVQVERLTDELGPLKQKLVSLESENAKLKEENMHRAELVISLSKDKAAFDKRLDEVNVEMTEKQMHINHLQSKLADVDGDYKTLIRNSDLHRSKTSKLLEEKDDQIDALQEKIKTMEKRFSDSSLSGDDRLSAFQQEREVMEQKLSESRQQLTEIKSTWSDKITQLEIQISHLNTKIAEDSEEYAASQKMTDQMRENFHKQVEDLKVRLDDAEQRALESLELASSKETHYEKQIEEMVQEFDQQRRQATDIENQLRASITLLESQGKELETARKVDEDSAKSTIRHLEEQTALLAEERYRLEAQTKALDENLTEFKKMILEKDEEINTLKKEIQERELTSNNQKSTIVSLQQLIYDLRIEVDVMKRAREEFERHLRNSEEEKGGLLENNADLLRQVQVLRSSSSDSRLELQRMVELKSNTIESMRKTEAALRQQLDSLQQTIEQNEISKAESGLYSDRIDEMNDTISSLQTQLAEKHRIIKKQEQTLKDLRVTLQRELKIQALPNDEELDLTANNTSSSTPVLSRKYGSDSRLCPKPQELQQNELQNNQQTQQYYTQSSLSHSSKAGNSSAAVPFPQTSSNLVASLPSTLPAPSGATNALTVHTTNMKRDLNKDINFLYLKHVVLKFMLSRESEAIQLIKAVSMLLNFSQQEQQLIKETLEWKMSWFGHRPPVGKGQTSKVIPPTL